MSLGSRRLVAPNNRTAFSSDTIRVRESSRGSIHEELIDARMHRSGGKE